MSSVVPNRPLFKYTNETIVYIDPLVSLHKASFHSSLIMKRKIPALNSPIIGIVKHSKYHIPITFDLRLLSSLIYSTTHSTLWVRAHPYLLAVLAQHDSQMEAKQESRGKGHFVWSSFQIWSLRRYPCGVNRSILVCIVCCGSKVQYYLTYSAQL